MKRSSSRKYPQGRRPRRSATQSRAVSNWSTRLARARAMSKMATRAFSTSRRGPDRKILLVQWHSCAIRSLSNILITCRLVSTLLRQEVGALRPQKTGAGEVGAQGSAGVARRRGHLDNDGGGGLVLVLLLLLLLLPMLLPLLLLLGCCFCCCRCCCCRRCFG